MDSNNSSKTYKDLKIDLKYQELSSIDPKLMKKIKRFVIYTDLKGTELFLITRSDYVFGFGPNNNGRLGFGHNKEVKEPIIIPELCGKDIIDIKCRNDFSVALTQSGQIYTFGCSGRGLTGNGDTIGHQKPEPISVNSQIITAIECTEYSTYMLSQTGQLYWFGYFHWDNSSVLTPTQVIIPFKTKIISFSSGFDHILALTDSGKAISWGRNTRGQLGLGHKNNTKSPQIIELKEDIKQVYCGSYHSLILTTDGKIYSMGDNYYGQLGIGNKTRQNSPQLVLTEQKEISCYRHISMSLDINNKLYVWGTLKHIVSPDLTEETSFQEVVNNYADHRSTLRPVELLKPINSLIKSMTKMFDNQKNSDLKFKVKRKDSSEFRDIYCHKCFIEETMDYFQTMFANNWKENKTNEIIITDYSFEAYYQYLKSLYTNSFDCKDFEVLLEILSITEKYMDWDKQFVCVELIKEMTNLENVCFLYSNAIKNRTETLRHFAFEIMWKNLGILSETNDYKNMEPIYAKEFLTEYQQMLLKEKQ